MKPFIHQIVERQARAAPDAVALAFEDQQVCYRELEQRANRLAHHLVALGVRPEHRVALWFERGVNQVVALLATWKAGAAGVPLDPAYPAQRLRFMLEDSEPAVVLTQLGMRDPPLAAPLNSLCIDAADALAQISQQPDVAPDPDALGLEAHSLACLIYTSGSTGRPKAVMLHHAGLSALVDIEADLFALDRDSRVLQFSSPSFDASLLDLSMALCHGARLCLAPQEAMRPGPPLVHTLQRHGVTHLTVPPSALSVLDAEVVFLSVKTLVVAGEVCPPAVTRRWAPRHRLINIYGPTETSVFVTAEVCQAEYDGPTPIGRPISPAQVHILDEGLQPVAPGERGEIYIGGACVSRGYHRRPELTEQRFVPDPFSKQAEARLYRTGDVARWLPQGNIEYLGRNDHQVKLRGFRIELGEIERCLMNCAGVREAVVLCREDVAGDKRLVAYLTGTSAATWPGAAQLRQHVQQSLPDHMLPSAWVRLPHFPLTPNGKTDRAALPPPAADAFQTAPYEAPSSATEIRLAAIWQTLLGVDRVGRHDNFFVLGGHSLRATQMVSRVRASMGVELALRTVFEHARLDALAECLDAAPPAHPCGAADTGTAPVRLPRSEVEQAFPCSYSQRRMWLVQQITPESTAYNVAMALRLQGELDTGRLRQALQLVCRRHEAFRTRFELVDGEPAQLITAPRAPPVVPAHVDSDLKLIDLRGKPVERRDDEARSLLGDFTVRPFNLSQPGLHRTLLIRLDETQSVLLWVMHHIIADLWSIGLLLDEVTQAYLQLQSGHAPTPPPMPLEYADYAAWQRAGAQDTERQAQLAYWLTQLRDLPVLDVPTDTARLGPLSGRGGTVHVDLPVDRIATLKQFCNRHGTTPFVTLLACFQLMLSRRCQQLDFAVGVPVANRHHLASEGLVGTLVNTLALRANLSGDPSFADLQAQVHDTALQAFTHQDTPFEQLVEKLGMRRDKTHSPLVQVLFNVVNTPLNVSHFAGLAVDQFNFDQRAAQFDLSMSLDLDAFKQIQLEYSTDLFSHASAQRMADGYLALLDQVLADPNRQISTYPLPSADEVSTLARWNHTARDFHGATQLHSLISAGAAEWPDRPALHDHTTSLSHGELDQRSSQLARELRRRGVGRGMLVGLCLERSADMVVALLAVLKSGAAYVPLDPGYPAERLAYIAQDAQLGLLINQSGTASVLPWSQAQSLTLDVEAARIHSLAPHALEPAAAHDASPDDPAYVIYTSGSTGQPKGVVVPHRAVVNFLQSMRHQPGLQADDRLLAVTTLSFDIAVLELLLPLVVGAQVDIAHPAQLRDGHALRERLESSGATAMQATPATWQLLIGAGWMGSPDLKVLVGGEALSPDLAQELLCRSGELWNLYGPTETTVWSTLCKLGDPDSGICIGRPIANTQIHVLDEQLRPCPIGVPGELCIAGAGLALGYWRRPELTAERFVRGPSPGAAGGAGELMYRTGDRGRWRHNGELEHLGRFDNQIKLRGYRIELGEIESMLCSHTEVAQCLVAVRQPRPGDSRLVAYVTAKHRPPQAQDLRKHLQHRLPEYMVPQHYVVLNQMPRLPNGKLDRAALPAHLDAPAPSDGDFWVPRTDAEVAIAKIWQQLLGLDRLSSSDNFFDLGGHSLLAVRAISRIEAALGLRVSVRRLLFENLGQLAASCNQPPGEAPAPGNPKPSTMKYLVSGLQRMLLNRGVRDGH